MSAADHTDLDDLDAVFAEAKAFLREQAAEAQQKAKAPRRVGAVSPGKIEPSALFSNPANWREGRHVALIHKETQTLLGHFLEMTHKTVPDCRRLVRQEKPAELESVEYVSGDWGHRAPQQPFHIESSISEHLRSLFIELEGLGVGAVCALRIVTQGVGILRVELDALQTFGGAGIVLELPSGTNLLPVMTKESKINIRRILDEL